MKKKKRCHCGSNKEYKNCCFLLGPAPVREISHNEITTHLSLDGDKKNASDWTTVLEKIEAKDWIFVKQEIERLELFYPDDFMLTYVKGMYLVEQGQDKKAMPYLKQVTIMNPFFAEGLYNLGVIYLKLSFYLHACVMFEEIVHLSEAPSELRDKAIDFPEVFETEICRPLDMSLEEFLQKLTRMAVAYEFVQEEAYRIALFLFTQSEGLSALENNRFGGLALCYTALGDHEIALECIETWLEWHPGHPVALHFRKEISALCFGEEMPSVLVLSLLRELDPEFLPKPFAKYKPTRESIVLDTSSWGQVALDAIEAGDWKGAVEEIRRLRWVHPGKAFLFFLQGRLLFKQNELLESVAYYKLSIKKEPDFALAYKDLGLVYEKLHLYKEAAECYERASAIGVEGGNKAQEMIV